MQGVTGRQLGPFFPEDVLREEVPRPGTGPETQTWMERYSALILGSLVVLLSLLMIVGGAYARSEINQQEAAAFGFQEEARAFALERDDLAASLEAALTQVDEVEAALSTAGIEVDEARADLATALQDIEQIEGRLAEQDRLLSQARAEAARQQETVQGFEAVVALDDDMLQLTMHLTNVVVPALVTAEIPAEFDAALAEWDAVIDELNRLLAIRNEMLADL
jgi:septal ring factor EnvC (AmiA/AmiB activator)